MLVLRTRHTDAEIAEMRERNKDMLKGISFSEEWLSKQPPVSKETAEKNRKIAASAWEKCFLSDEECKQLKRELGGDIDPGNPRLPQNFCAWSWWKASDDVRKSTMLEF